MTLQEILHNQPLRREQRIATWIIGIATVGILTGVYIQFIVYKFPDGGKSKALSNHYNPNAEVEKAQKYLLALKQQ